MARNESLETASTTPAAATETGEVESKKNRQVNATISGELYAVLDDHRWTARIDRMPKLVAVALQEYAENHGLLTK